MFTKSLISLVIPEGCVKDFSMKALRRTALTGLAALALGCVLIPSQSHAQTRLKWAHVYETSEPYHKWAVWAGEELKKRTSGKYEIQVFPASSLGKESDINQGLQLGTVDMIYTGASFAARSFPRLAVSYYPFTFSRCRSRDQVQQERCLS